MDREEFQARVVESSIKNARRWIETEMKDHPQRDDLLAGLEYLPLFPFWEKITPVIVVRTRAGDRYTSAGEIALEFRVRLKINHEKWTYWIANIGVYRKIEHAMPCKEYVP